MSRDKTRHYESWDDDDEQDFYEEGPRRPTTTRPRTRPRPQGRPPRRKKRSVWPWLLAGCAGGVILLVLAAATVIFLALRTATNGGSLGSIGGIVNPTTYTQQVPAQQLSLGSITQINVHNQIGNVTITTDPNATQTTIAAVKRVKATSSDDANKEFGNITLQVQPPGTPPNTLTVNATVPDNGNILGNHNDAVDLTITLPPSGQGTLPAVTATPSLSLPTPTVPATPTTVPTTTATITLLTLSVDMSIGNVTVNGLSGVLGIKNDIGNITVNNATLFDGSHLQTATGNVTFTGNVNPLPTTGNTTPRYKLQSETGQIEVTLPSTTNVILDANTNAGTITSDFPINVTSASGGANFYGPLIPNTGTGSPQAVLTLNVSSGKVIIHKMP